MQLVSQQKTLHRFILKRIMMLEIRRHMEITTADIDAGSI
jgi:hypothetical protein